MLVINKGREKLLLTDYDGKRYAFHQGVPVEISPEIYNAIILSGHISAQDIVPYEAPKEAPKETMTEKVEKVVKKMKDAVKPSKKKKK